MIVDLNFEKEGCCGIVDEDSKLSKSSIVYLSHERHISFGP
jgi:hypothetical protein